MGEWPSAEWFVTFSSKQEIVSLNRGGAENDHEIYTYFSNDYRVYAVLHYACMFVIFVSIN